MQTVPAATRREQLIELLRESQEPLTGSELADRLGVSRQVIVQDFAILRARGDEIFATPRGYVLPSRPPAGVRAVLAVRHGRGGARDELTIMVDHGLKVVDVIVEHPIYGELRGSLMMSSRRDVDEFSDRLDRGEISLMSELSGGLHLHTVEAPNEERLTQVRSALRARGFLVE